MGADILPNRDLNRTIQLLFAEPMLFLILPGFSMATHLWLRDGFYFFVLVPTQTAALYSPHTATAKRPERRRRSAHSEGWPVRILSAQTNGKPDGPSATYHENGQLITEVTYKNGKADGAWVHYDENGKKVE